jgi:hypothetical protein
VIIVENQGTTMEILDDYFSPVGDLLHGEGQPHARFLDTPRLTFAAETDNPDGVRFLPTLQLAHNGGVGSLGVKYRTTTEGVCSTELLTRISSDGLIQAEANIDDITPMSAAMTAGVQLNTNKPKDDDKCFLSANFMVSDIKLKLSTMHSHKSGTTGSFLFQSGIPSFLESFQFSQGIGDIGTNDPSVHYGFAFFGSSWWYATKLAASRTTWKEATACFYQKCGDVEIAAEYLKTYDEAQRITVGASQDFLTAYYPLNVRFRADTNCNVGIAVRTLNKSALNIGITATANTKALQRPSVGMSVLYGN